MSGILSALESLFQPTPSDPAAAAAMTVLADPPTTPDRLDPALMAVAPDLTADERAAWVAALAGPLHRAGISGARCVAAFLGQCSQESAGFRVTQEDLFYSAERLCQVWPSRFPTIETAQPCAGRPEALANTVYADRMGNGDPASGDGWRFRGRGLIQLTGRSAYESFARATGITLDAAVEQAGTQAGAVATAAWFWTANGLNALAETWAIDTITQKINGGMNGAADRIRLCEAALHAMEA